MEIACRCKQHKMNFMYLTDQDLPNGWECDDCQKNLIEKATLEPEAPKVEVKKDKKKK